MGSTEITTGQVTLATEGARRFEAYRATPAAGTGPGILVLHDMFGISPPFEALAQDYARRGHAVLIPNQFWRSEPSDTLPYGAHERAWARLETFDTDRAVEGMRIAIAALRAMPACNGKVAALGFCFSGRLAFLAATRTDADAAIGFYALGIARHLDEARRVACPLQLHYGGKDEHVPQSEVDAVAGALAGMRGVDLHLYPEAGHSFFNPVRPTFDPAAAALAASRVDALLARLA